jgi:SAM-dependent methyltransferase
MNGRDAAYFDRWYAGRVESPVADGIVQRVLGLPPELQSTSLLTWDGLEDVVGLLELRPGQALLDLACGRGGYGLEIARRTGARLIGVDFSKVAVEQAQRNGRARGVAVDFRIGELTRTGLDAESVDAVVIVDAVQFAEPALDALRECRRILVPGGRLVITCWEARDRGDERLPEPFRRLDLAKQLPEAGFTQVEVTEKPTWRAAERALWQEAVALDPGEDTALRSLQEEGQRVLAIFDSVRRVLAVAG